MNENREYIERRLSEFLDGGLTDSEAMEVEAALERDPELSRIAEELRTIRDAARELGSPGSDADLWPGIRAAIGALPRSSGLASSRRVFLPVGPLAAAAVLLVVCSGLVGVALGSSSTPAPWDSVAGGVPAIVAEMPEFRHYPRLIQQLEGGVARLEQSVDPRGAVAVDREIAAYDRAILEAARAVSIEPESEFLRQRLAQALEGKVTFLRRVDGSALFANADQE